MKLNAEGLLVVFGTRRKSPTQLAPSCLPRWIKEHISTQEVAQQELYTGVSLSGGRSPVYLTSAYRLDEPSFTIRKKRKEEKKKSKRSVSTGKRSKRATYVSKTLNVIPFSFYGRIIFKPTIGYQREHHHFGIEKVSKLPLKN